MSQRIEIMILDDNQANMGSMAELIGEEEQLVMFILMRRLRFWR